MKKKIGLVLLLCAFAVPFWAADDEYSQIKQNAKSKSELIQKTLEYEDNHSKELAPKSDLALYYVLEKNYDKAEEYLKDGEKLINKAKSPPDPFYVAQLYYTYGRFYYESKEDLQKAKEYADKAFAVENEGEQFGYLKAYIAAELKNAEEAYELFNFMYEKYPEKADGPCLTMFTQLAVFYEDFDKACNLLDVFFEKHAYTPKILFWASQVYEKGGNYMKALYSAVLVHEFTACYDSSRNEVFRENLKKMHALAVSENNEEKITALNAVMDLFESLSGKEEFVGEQKKVQEETASAELALEEKSSAEGELAVVALKDKTPADNAPAENSVEEKVLEENLLEDNDLDFIPYNFIQLKKKIKNGTVNKDDVIKLTSYDANLKELPSYYWLLAQAVRQVADKNDPFVDISVVRYLGSVVDMGKSEYEKLAREKICDICWIKEEDRSKFLSAKEIVELCASYYEKKDQKKVDRILDSISLSNNSCYGFYLVKTLDVVNRFKAVYPDFNKACKKWHKKNPDAKMPIFYR